MAKELTTALILRDRVAEWTTLAREKSAWRIVEYQREPLESPASEPDDSARDERVRALSRRWPGAIHVGLPSESLLLRIVNLPNADANEMREMVRLQLDKIAPFPLEEMVFSHETLAVGQDFSRILMVAARRAAAEDIARALNDARLRPARMDAAVMGWQPLLKNAGAFPENGRHANLIVSADESVLWISQNGDPIAIRALRGHDQTVPGADSYRDMAEEIRHTLMALELEHGPESAVSLAVWHENEPPSEASDAFRTLAGLEPVFRPLSELPPLSEGLARRAAQQGDGLLDLTPEQWRATEQTQAFRRRFKRTAQLLIGLWTLAMAAVLGGNYWQEARLETVRAEQTAWAEAANEVRDLRARIRMIREYTDTKQSALETLREVVRLLPDGIELTLFDYRKGNSARIGGQADSVNQVYDYKTRMDGSALFLNAELTGPRYDARRKKQLFDMELALPEKESL